MTDRERTADYVTLTVTGSKPLFHPDGTTALCLRTQEKGAIAFRVDLQAISVLRNDLAKCETFLAQPTGKA
jgi:hypothetical protein